MSRLNSGAFHEKSTNLRTRSQDVLRDQRRPNRLHATRSEEDMKYVFGDLFVNDERDC